MVHLDITSAMKAKKSVKFQLRYKGQIVAILTGNTNGKHKLSTKGYSGNNWGHFGCKISLEEAEWDGKDAAEFRKHFKNRKGPRINDNCKGNDEHHFESLLLTEFSKVKGKKIRNIKPVRFGRVRFPMPTPINASNHNISPYPQYGENDRGGGIDILARTGTGGKATHLCVMELKDQNKPSEPPKDTLKQALAYTTFIRELLRSDAGEYWWKKVFGFRGNIPQPLVLYAACVMPSNPDYNYSFDATKLNIGEDIIELHNLYFKFEEENDEITIESNNTTLPIVIQRN